MFSVLYTKGNPSVIPFWNRETKCNIIALIHRKMIWGDLKKNIFLNPKRGAFGSEKTVFAVQGGNFSKKKILRFWKSLKYV